MKTVNFATLVACATLLAGCVAAPPAINPLDAAAKKFQPESGKASLYLSRQGDVAGSGTTLQIVLDDHIAGQLPPASYQLISVDPGEHVLALNVTSGEAQTLTPARFKNESVVKINALPGNNYFYRASLRLGWGQASLNLVPVSSAEGRKDVSVLPLGMDH